jgi:hypothetical protein
LEPILKGSYMIVAAVTGGGYNPIHARITGGG